MWVRRVGSVTFKVLVDPVRMHVHATSSWLWLEHPFVLPWNPHKHKHTPLLDFLGYYIILLNDLWLNSDVFLPHLWGMDDALALSFTLLLRVFTVTGESGKKSAPFQPYVLSSSRRLGCVCVKWCLAFIALISINNILHVWHIIWWLAGRHKHTELIDNQQGKFWKLGIN